MTTTPTIRLIAGPGKGQMARLVKNAAVVVTISPAFTVRRGEERR